MKHVYTSSLGIPETSGRFLYAEGRVGEVNQSVLDYFETQNKDLDKGDEQRRLVEAKNFALGQIPSLATDVMSDIGKHYNTVKNLESASKAEDLKKDVKGRVFGVLKEGSKHGVPAWGKNYRELIKDIDNDSNNAILTLTDTDRALQAATELKSKYERQAQVLIDRKNEVDQTKKSWGNLGKWFKSSVKDVDYETKDGTSEKARFEAGHEVAVGVFESIRLKLDTQKNKAESIFEDNKSHIQDNFDILSLDQKGEFIEAVRTEVNGTDTGMEKGSGWMAAIVSGMTYAQRVEIFKSMDLDPTRTLNTLANQKQQYEGIEGDVLQRRKKLSSGLVKVNKANISYLKSDIKGINKDESFDPSDKGDFKSFVSELSNYVNNQGDFGSSDLLKGYPQTVGTNDYERFVAYFGFLFEKRKTHVADRMGKKLKAKLLTYLEYLQQLEAPDKLGYSNEFRKQKDKTKQEYKSAKKLIGGLKSTKSVKDIKEGTYEEIGEFLGQRKRNQRVYNAFKEDSENLSSEEVALLDKWHEELDSVAEQIRSFQQKWESERKGYDVHYRELIKKQKETQKSQALYEAEIENLKEEEEALERDLAKAEEKVALVEDSMGNIEVKSQHQITKVDNARYNKLGKDRTVKERVVNALEKEISEKRSKRYELQSKISSSKLTSNQITSDISEFNAWSPEIASEFDFTSAQKNFAELLGTIDDDMKDFSDPKYSEKRELQKTSKDQLKHYFVEASARENNELYKEQYETLQNENLATLQKLQPGTNIGAIEYIKYLEDSDVTSESALKSEKGRIENAIVLENTIKDAIVLIADDEIILVQKGERGRVEVLTFPSPEGYDTSKSLPPEYMPKRSSMIGELTTITA